MKAEDVPLTMHDLQHNQVGKDTPPETQEVVYSMSNMKRKKRKVVVFPEAQPPIIMGDK